MNRPRSAGSLREGFPRRESGRGDGGGAGANRLIRADSPVEVVADKLEGDGAGRGGSGPGPLVVFAADHEIAHVPAEAAALAAEVNAVAPADIHLGDNGGFFAAGLDGGSLGRRFFGGGFLRRNLGGGRGLGGSGFLRHGRWWVERRPGLSSKSLPSKFKTTFKTFFCCEGERGGTDLPFPVK